MLKVDRNGDPRERHARGDSKSQHWPLAARRAPAALLAHDDLDVRRAEEMVLESVAERS